MAGGAARSHFGSSCFGFKAQFRSSCLYRGATIMMYSSYGGRGMAGGAAAGGAYGAGYGAGRAGGGACCVAQGEDCTACGVGCGGGGQGSLAYVGSGPGDYIQETTYKYVGCGGDFARPPRDFTCLITTCCLLSLLLLIPLLLWLLSGTATSLPYDCESGF